jgi:hypothetical protein
MKNFIENFIWPVVVLGGLIVLLTIIVSGAEVEKSTVEKSTVEKVKYKTSRYDLECIDGVVYLSMENRFSVKMNKQGYIESCDE